MPLQVAALAVALARAENEAPGLLTALPAVLLELVFGGLPAGGVERLALAASARACARAGRAVRQSQPLRTRVSSALRTPQLAAWADGAMGAQLLTNTDGHGVRVCEMAAGGGHLATLQWAREHGCEWDEGTWAAAEGGGHLATLQWAREHGCPNWRASV